MSDTTQRLSLKEKVGYACGDVGFNFYWKNIEVYLLFFYTDVFGISAAAVGTMFLVTRIIDAFTDPAMGAIADRTNTRFGKFRPYLIWMALPMAAAGVLAFTTPDMEPGGKLVWAYGTYILMMVVYTAINIPYSAMLGVITADGQERTTLSSFRFVGAFSGGVLVTWFTPKLVLWLGGGNEQLGWQLAMGVYGILAALFFFTTFTTTTERVTPPPNQKTNFKQDLHDLIHNGPWMLLFALGLIIIMTISLRNASAAYYFKYYVEREDLMGGFLTATMIAYAVGAAITPLLTRWLGKKRLLIVLMSAVGLLSIAFFFIPKDGIWMMFALSIAISLCLGPKSPLVWSMYADSADYSEWKVGRRATALVFAAATFSLKLGGALAGALIGWLLGAMGYSANQVQTNDAQTTIVLLLTVIPGLFALLAAFVARFYTLDGPTMDRLQAELEARKA